MIELDVMTILEGGSCDRGGRYERLDRPAIDICTSPGKIPSVVSSELVSVIIP